MFYVYFMIYFSGLYVYCSNRKHVLLMLMGLEFMVLGIFMLMLFFMCVFNNEFFFLMMYLTFCVCESVLGLSVLVSIIRSHGNDYFYSLNMLW